MRSRYENKAIVTGTVMTAPVYTQSIKGKKYYGITLESKRLSSNSDKINTLVSGSVINETPLRIGDTITLSGSIKTFNNKSGAGNKLRIVFVADAIEQSSQTENEVILTGNICKTPIYRKTPLGREICDIMLAVPDGVDRANFLPCIAWGKSARMLSCLQVKQCLRIKGRLQSREYVKKNECSEELKTAFEISISSFQILP